MDRKTLSARFGLSFYLDKKFSSSVDNYRQNIRQHMVNHYSLSNDFLNLEQLPRTSDKFFSISHNPEIGGYVSCSQPVGFDIEEISRIKIDVIKRISEENEWRLFDDQRWLWPAKEALVKLFTEDKKSTPLMSDFKINQYNQNQYETSKAFGFFWQEDKLLYSVAFKKN